MDRLHKIISAAGLTSRRQAEEWIRAGRVSVDGVTITEVGTSADWDSQRIEVDGKIVLRTRALYFLMYKPFGVISSMHDPEGRPTVRDLMLAGGVKERVYPVGRLDYDSEGLLLLTNDGAAANRLSHPRHGVEKEYEVELTDRPSPDVLQELEKGIRLADGLTSPAKISGVKASSDGNWLVRITIHEGKNRQVRRMFEAMELIVRRLVRVRYAFLTIDGLAKGTFRPLNPTEINKIAGGW